MSRNQNNTPEMDYYELRRRHEEYKARTSAPVRPRIEMKAETPAEDIENVQPAQTEPVKEARPDAAPEADRSFEEEIEAEERKNARPEGSAPASDNPFASFLQFASRVKGKMRPRRGGRHDEDEMYDDVDFDEALDADPAAPAEHDDEGVDLSDDPREYEEAVQAGDIADVEFAEPAYNRAPHAHPDDDYGDAGYDDEDYDEYADEPYDDADEDASSDDQPHGFKKFLNLFITRVDPDEETDDAPYDDGYYDDDYEDEYPDETADDAVADDSEEFGSVYFQEPTVSRRDSVPSGIEGGHKDMDDMQNLSSEHIHQMAEGLENSGMTRRERRELAQRRAAEEAAKREAEAKAAAPVPSVYDAPAQAADAEKPAPAAEAPAVEKTVDAPSENANKAAEPETFIGVVEEPTREFKLEEPTREFKPVNSAAVDAPADDLFDVDADEETDADDSDDGEDYEEERKPHRGLFGWRARKRAKEDEEDFDDDDEGDEDEDADEEEDDSRSRRKHHRKHHAEEAEEDEFDEEYADDSQDDDYDEYDEYDEDADDEDDEYDDEDEDDEDDYDDEFDDDESGRSFGHHLVGVLMVVLGIILVLLLAIIVLNFSCINGGNKFVDSLYNRFGDTGAFKFMFPAYEVLPESTGLTETTEITPLETTPEPAAEPTAAPVSEISIPSFDGADAGNTADTAAAMPSASATAATDTITLEPIG